MDRATLLGIVAALGLMGYAIADGGRIALFLNLPALLLVVGGTLGAVLIYYPMHKVLGIFSIVQKAFLEGSESYLERMKMLTRFAEQSRREGVLSLTDQVRRLDDKFFKRCMQMAIDGTDPAEVSLVMGREIATISERHRIGAEIFSTMGTFAPAMGMIGTLIGLVQMLQALDTPASVGPAMSVALLSTLYGALLANLAFFPLSGKLRYRSWTESVMREMTLEGVVGIARGDHPSILEQKLLSYITPEVRQNKARSTGKRRAV